MKTTFEITDEVQLEVIPKPIPSVKALPDFFKNLKPFTEGDQRFPTAKKCVPMIDALTAGYIIPFPADILVTVKETGIQFTYPENWSFGPLTSEHDIDQLEGHPKSHLKFGGVVFKFMNPWIVTTEPGVSCIFTQPFNHLETKYSLFTGTVDTDTYYNQVNFPFIWEEEKEGQYLLKKGSPMVQVIPFRREEDQDFEVKVADAKKKAVTTAKLGTVMNNGYRNLYWHKGDKE